MLEIKKRPIANQQNNKSQMEEECPSFKKEIKLPDGDKSCTKKLFDIKKVVNCKRRYPNKNSCKCYGEPKVCTTCVVKKSQQAPRAGTPGFRPPEVLLKYERQTTGKYAFRISK